MAVITVKTGGPLQDFSNLNLKPNTFNKLAELIADEIDDTTGEYNLQIAQSIANAIRYCERENFWFNESRDFTFLTVDEQQWYGDETTLILLQEDKPVQEEKGWFSKIISIPWIFCSYGPPDGSIKRRLDPVSPDQLEYLSDKSAARGIPDCYAYFNQKLRLYPIPSGGPYQIRITGIPVRLSDIKNPDEYHPWFVEACDMIKARAKYSLYKNYLKDVDMATEAMNDFEEQRNMLRYETSKRISGDTRKILKATSF